MSIVPTEDSIGHTKVQVPGAFESPAIVLGNKLWSPARAGSPLSREATSPAPLCTFQTNSLLICSLLL